MPEAQLDAWFSLVAKGRAEGPTSPYYVSSFGVQQIASGGTGHDFPGGKPAGTLYVKHGVSFFYVLISKQRLMT